MNRSTVSRDQASWGIGLTSRRLPRNLLPALVFASVYLAALVLVIAPRHVFGTQDHAVSAPSLSVQNADAAR